MPVTIWAATRDGRQQQTQAKLADLHQALDIGRRPSRELMTQHHLSYPITASMSCDSSFLTTSPDAASSIRIPAVLSRRLASAFAQAHEDVLAVGPDGEHGDRPGCRR